jgi:hypothetical protein
VELSVVLHELGVVLGGRRGPARGLHRCQVALVPCSRSSGGGRGLELNSEDQGLENRLPFFTDAVQDARRRLVALGGADDERAAAPAAPALEEPFALEELDRLLDGGPADSEKTGELPFRRERLPGSDEPECDLPSDLLSHQLVRPELLERTEDRLLRSSGHLDGWSVIGAVNAHHPSSS